LIVSCLLYKSLSLSSFASLQTFFAPRRLLTCYYPTNPVGYKSCARQKIGTLFVLSMSA
jgi:hypothetical protein